MFTNVIGVCGQFIFLIFRGSVVRTVWVKDDIFYDLMNSPPRLYFSGEMIRNTGNIVKLNAYNCRYTDGFISAYFLFYFCVNGNSWDRSRCFIFISILGSLILCVL